jgi:hypothetical protein
MDPHAPQPYGAPPGGAQPGSGPPDYALERRATKPEDAREIAKNVVVISKAPQRRSRFDQVISSPLWDTSSLRSDVIFSVNFLSRHTREPAPCKVNSRCWKVIFRSVETTIFLEVNFQPCDLTFGRCAFTLASRIACG